MILVFTYILTVQGIRILNSTITECEINGNCKVNFTATENVLKESVPLLYFGFLQCKLALRKLDDR